MAHTRLTPLPPSLAVFLGGVVGGSARLALDVLIPDAGMDIPVEVVVINIVGSGALGLLTGWGRLRGPRWWVPMVATGALGAFTTFSALAAAPWVSGSPALVPLIVLAATFVGAIAAAALGWWGGSRLARLTPDAVTAGSDQ